MNDDDDNPTARVIRVIRDDERQRCIKVLTELFDNALPDAFRDGIEASIAAIEAPTPPVASSPVGGER